VKVRLVMIEVFQTPLGEVEMELEGGYTLVTIFKKEFTINGELSIGDLSDEDAARIAAKIIKSQPSYKDGTGWLRAKAAITAANL